MEKSGIGQMLQARRIELALTQRQIANFVGVTETTVLRWESDEIDNMRRDKIAGLAEVLRVSPLLIMGDEKVNSTHMPPTAEKLKLRDGWHCLGIDDKNLVCQMIKRLRLTDHKPYKITAPVSARVINGNLHNVGVNFNSVVSSQKKPLTHRSTTGFSLLATVVP